MQKIYKILAHKSVGLLILRVFIGVIFIIHGVQKFQNVEAMIAFFSQLGLNSFWFYTVATVETLGGIALILGVFTRFAAIALAVIMVFAIALFKSKIGAGSWLTLFAASELDLAILGANLALVFTGSGKLSVAHWCKCSCHGSGKMCKVCPWIGCEHSCNECKSCDSNKSHTDSVPSGQM